MSVKLNTSGMRYAKSLIKRGKVDRDSGWEFSAKDADNLLTAGDWELYEKAHLSVDSSVPDETKERWSFPVVKDGLVSMVGISKAAEQAAKDGRSADAAELLSLLGTIPDQRVDSVKRMDISDWMWDICTTPMRKTDEGFLLGRAAVTNIGVFPYPQADGSVIYELRCPEEVFHPDSLRTLEGKVLTNDHPRDGVNPDNAQALQVGSISNPGCDPYRVYCDVAITVKGAISDVQTGKRALSCGYTCDLDPTAGVWMGVAYTHIQRNIRYNHVALVDKGRAGDDAILRMDGATSVSITQEPTRENLMRKIRLDNGAEGEADELVILELDTAKKNAKLATEQADKAVADLATAQKELETAKGNLDAAADRVASLEKELAEKTTVAPAVLDAAVTSRVALLDTAKSLGAEVTVADSDSTIKAAVIKLVAADVNLDGKSAEYIDARFDGAVDTLKKSALHAGSHQMRELPTREDGVDAVSAARAASKTHLHSAWKN